MYKSIFIGIDGSPHSEYVQDAALLLVENTKKACIQACHIYTVGLHRMRFNEMEPGLPEQYQDEERLDILRKTHDDLIVNGMDLISNAYISSFLSKVESKAIHHEVITAEGRNYVKMIEIINDKKPELVVLGAQGHGAVPEESLGSVAERVITHVNDRDLLIMRNPLNVKGRPIVVGIDGSQNSFTALYRAMLLAKKIGASIHAIAVYDPYFHQGVFKTISGVLPPEAQKRFNFSAQEVLHDEIIDKGLEKLYAEGLERGKRFADEMNIPYESIILKGKVFAKIYHYAAVHDACMIAVGRWGRHKEDISMLGSSTLRLARLSTTNVLIVAPASNPIDGLEAEKPVQKGTAVEWTSDALKILERIPEFARKMARGAIESRATEDNLVVITADYVQAFGKKMGMG
ncbi:MAG TPA: universal stress protein [Candidatus Lokiarchaeia archaeon]|nr:universal stress protein [Candidatus Lokiarchaeia archaeon]